MRQGADHDSVDLLRTVNVSLHAGATSVLADVDPVSMTVDPREIATRITPGTRAIIVVHFAKRC
jgi:dTDP-4-amino-4,6-dideoxygalactose transaminase